MNATVIDVGFSEREKFLRYLDKDVRAPDRVWKKREWKIGEALLENALKVSRSAKKILPFGKK